MEPIVSSETSAIRTQTPGNYPKRNKLHYGTGFKNYATGSKNYGTGFKNYGTGLKIMELVSTIMELV